MTCGVYQVLLASVPQTLYPRARYEAHQPVRAVEHIFTVPPSLTIFWILMDQVRGFIWHQEETARP